MRGLDVTKIYSVSGLLPADIPLILQRPFRSLHHIIGNAGLVGKGHLPRERQLQRFREQALTCNAEMGASEVHAYCEVEAPAEKLLKATMQQLHLSARAYHRVLKLARTIADLAGSEKVVANYVAEAIQYRPRVGM